MSEPVVIVSATRCQPISVNLVVTSRWLAGSFSFVALSSFNLWQAGICALRKGQRHVQRSLDLKLADAVEFIEAKLDVQTDDVGQMLAQTRTEQRAQYAELKRDIIDVYTCIVDVTGAVTSASTPLPPQPHEQLDGQRTLESLAWWQKRVEPVTPVLLPQVTPPTHLYPIAARVHS